MGRYRGTLFIALAVFGAPLLFGSPLERAASLERATSERAEAPERARTLAGTSSRATLIARSDSLRAMSRARLLAAFEHRDGDASDDEAPRTSPETSPGTPWETPPGTIDELREQIAGILAEHEIPGVGLALIDRDGVRWAGGVGQARRASRSDAGRDVDADTVFRVGSISKTIIALAVLRLVDEGRLRLDTPVAEIAPEIAMDNPWAASAPVTVAHLLEHTAGFDDMRFNETFSPSHDDLPLAEVLALNPRSRTSRWRPGSRHAYSNPGYTVIGHIIEKVTGEPFEDFVSRAILRPMGMPTASFRLTPGLRERLAQGYGEPRGRAIPHQRIHHRPAGELMASPRELARLVELFLHRGRLPSTERSSRRSTERSSRRWAGEPVERAPLISPAALARMERSATTSLPVLDTAYGLGNYGDTSLPVITRGHDGGLPGFLSEYRYSTELGIGHVVLFNSTSESVSWAGFEIRQLLFQYLTGGREFPAPPAIELPESELRSYTGYYELQSARFEFFAFLDRVFLGASVSLHPSSSGSGLHLDLGNGVSAPLIAAGPGRFRLPGHSGPLVVFDSLDDGTPIMLLGGLYYEQGSSSWGPTRRVLFGAAIWLMDIGVFGIIWWLPGWLWVMWRIRHRIPMPPGSMASLASIAFFFMMRLFDVGFAGASLGVLGLASGLIFILSLVFPLLSVLAVPQSLRWMGPGSELDRAELDAIVDEAGFFTSIYQETWRSRFYSVATSIACLAVAGFFTYHGFIAVRTWAW